MIIHNMFASEEDKGLSEDCAKCKSHEKCETPYMEYIGEGKMDCLIIGESPGRDDDNAGIPFAGSDGRFLKRRLSKLGLRLDEDFWMTNAVICRPVKDKPPSDKQLALCRKNLIETIDELQPRFIWTFGSIATKAITQRALKKTSISSLTNRVIPIKEFDSWLMPMYDPRYLIRNENDGNLHKYYLRNLRMALEFMKKNPDLPNINPFDRITVLRTPDEIENLICEIVNGNIPSSFDFEATGLFPWVEGHKTTTMAIATQNMSYAFPIQHPEAEFTEQEEEDVIDSVCYYLESKELTKIGHNVNFDKRWAYWALGADPVGHFPCTMTASHILDHRNGNNSLKDLAFLRWGIVSYDKATDGYIKTVPGTSFNRMAEMPLDDQLLYVGVDAKFTIKAYFEQCQEFTEGQERANEFFIASLPTLLDIQNNGIIIDVPYFKNAASQLEEEIAEIENKINKSRDAERYPVIYKTAFNYTSPKCLKRILFEMNDVKAVKFTDKGNESVDEDALAKIDYWMCKKIIKVRKLKKLKDTYISQYLRGEWEGLVHPEFQLHTVTSYRSSCIAGYEKVFVARNFISNPEGIPIRDIKVGDLVYCFDDNLNPQIKPVLQHVCTGKKEIMRIHYYRRGKYGQLDCTRDHLIRLTNGSYIKAEDIKRGDHTLACSRTGDYINFTRHLKHGHGIKEHRFLYSKLIGELKDEEVIHHKNEIHLDHTLHNLEKHTNASHASIHSKTTIHSKEGEENNRQVVKRLHKEGRYDHIYKSGRESYCWVELTKYQCLKMLATCAGKPKKTSDHFHMDFTTFKNKLSIHDIKWEDVAIRYDKYGKYITRGRLRDLSIYGRKKVSKILGHNFYRLLELYQIYQISPKNPYQGEMIEGNHIITKVDFLHKTVPVYDIEVEECHNFFANEICVHNCKDPNVQNTPKRNKRSKKLIRSGFITPELWKIFELDFSGMEVSTSAMYHLDPGFIHYLVTEGTDMHRDNTCDLWKMSPDFWHDLPHDVQSVLRFFGKNIWTFAQFYGDYFGSCGENLWKTCILEENIMLFDDYSLQDHINDMGISELGKMFKGQPTKGSFLEHCKEVENKMWNERFPIYTQWKKDINDFYNENGYTESLLGFRYNGYMDRKQTTNFLIQGTAFHLLMWCLAKINEKLKREKWESYLIGEVHDSMMGYVHPDEEKDLFPMMKQICTVDVVNEFDFINVPLGIDVELSETNGNFANLTEIKI